MINVHFYNSPILNESRIERETEVLKQMNIFNKIYIVGYKIENLPEYESLDSVRKIIRLDLSKSFIGKFYIFKVFLGLYYYIKSYMHFIRIKVDIVQTHNLMTLPLGVCFKIFKKSKLIYDAHELETQRSHWPKWLTFIAKFIERRLLHFVDEIIVVSESIADNYQETYNLNIRPTVLLNIPPSNKYNKSDYLRTHFSIPPNKLIFIYQGVLSYKRGIKEMLDTFSKTSLNVVLVFLGYGECENEIKSYALKHKSILFHKAVPYSNLLELTSSADYGMSFLLTENFCLSYYFAMPNKFFEYMQANLPIISSFGPDMSKLVNKFNLGIVCKNNKNLELSIKNIISKDYNIFQKNINTFNTKYNWENEALKLERLYNTVLNYK
jgi:glycosyltransferase involved in cell wall biosynthesis